MADASCGPSNAFKGLARHIEQDRSHQQDRVGPGSQHPAQNFRSTPLNTGLPDQFRAFQQQNAALPQYAEPGWKVYSHPTNTPSHASHAATFFPQQPTQQPAGFATSAGGSWVNDFQRMGFANAHAGPLHMQPTQGPIMGQPSMADPIHSGFSTRQHSTFPPFQSSPIGLHPINHQFGTVQNSNNMQTPELIGNTSHALDTQTEAILEREFEDAMNEWMVQNGPGAEMSGQSDVNAQDDNLTANPNLASTEPTVHDMPEKDSAENRDELSRAAAQLVDSLADNDSEKFKNSDFLALMRRIASQELTVQGNDLVETQQPTTDTPSGSHVTSSISAVPSTTANKPGSLYEKEQGPVDQVGTKQTSA
ncbi:hypothetical protein E0Z10_g8641 [Xylaria hypoxylon]|uniref:Peroxin 20 n=1 Tax=Xylaria hypoxylon TaxID=37992 RepID=A0A4Z0YRD4_9PEZI|nr:hypothetical protein E0Z10_g8641 [Xylaria hypoxylon]